MSFLFLCHSWEVQEVDDGLLVRCDHRDLDALTVPVLVDELFELALENGQANLYLDFGRVHYLASIVIGKLIALNERLHHIGGHVVVCNLDPSLYDPFRVARVTNLLDIRVNELQEVEAS